MTDIKDIPIHDIELFLKKNGAKFNKNTAYSDAFKLMKKGTNYYTDSIIEWMTAFNLLKLKIDIPLYSKSEILDMSNTELQSLANLLGMDSNKRIHVLNILKYLHKLEYEEETIFPSEIFRELIGNMNYNSIKKTCNSSLDMKILCHTKDMRNILVSKFMRDSLNTSSFTDDELDFYDKVKPLKTRMCLTNKDNQTILTICYNKLLVTLKNGKLNHEESDVNEIVTSHLYEGYNRANGFEIREINTILYDDGRITKDNVIFPLTNKIINISEYPFAKGNFNIITNKKEFYQWNGLTLLQYVNPFNVIQRFTFACLTDKGEVYTIGDEDIEIPADIKPDAFGEIGKIEDGIYRKLADFEYYKLHDLPRIIALTTTGEAISENGDVWVLDYYNLTAKKSDKYSNIIQIYEDKYTNYYLDNKGNIFTDSTKIETSKNLIEIAIDSDEEKIYALDDEMNLYIYNISGKLLQHYDLLKF
jgi:hypothetical protein